MNLKTSKLRDAISFALVVGATAVAGTGVAFAQDTGTEDQEEATTLDRIQVTGSRIKRADIETSQPVFSLSREEITAQGLTSVGDVIQNITSNGSTLNSTFNNGGNGETRVSLRNLGAQSTLVLVNGKRWIGGTGLGGAVDLNTIPTAAVERIEILKDGASTIYGSDAIAGVVNVILRKNFEGAEANAYYGVFDEGDGARQSYDFTIGAIGDRFSAMLGFGYVKEDPVWAGDREISSEPVYNLGPILNSSTSEFGNFSMNYGDCNGGRCRPDGTEGSFSYAPGADGADWRPYVHTRDSYNYAPDNYLLTPQERRSVFGNASLDVTDNVRFNTTITYNERLSEQFLAAMPVVLGVPAGDTPSGATTISPDSIYNPFGEEIDWIQRRVTETGGRSFRQNVKTFAMDANFQGTWIAGDKYYDWEVGYFRGQNQANNITEGLFNVLALQQALGPSMLIDGVPTCVTTPGDPTTAIGGCVPLNLLGAPGSVTDEMLAFSTFVAHDEYQYTMKNYYANLTGDLFELPAGPLGFAVGIEHRTEEGYDSPDALINSGYTTGNSRKATAGGYKVDEAYVEFAVPILSDMPFAQLLDVSVASRYSDYSNFGDTVNSKFGFRWKPIDDLMVRGNWSEGFRAPSIAELFSGQGDSFPTFQDPCSTVSFANQTPTAQATCIAQGVPDGGYDQNNPQIRITVGGNPNLMPEEAVSKTLGLVYSPNWVAGLDVSLDWWNIKVENQITTVGPQTIIQRCIDSGGTDPTCALYSRGQGGIVLSLLNANTNIGGTQVEGYDLTVNYRLPETSFGNFSFTWDSTYLASEEDDIDGDGVYGEDAQLEPAIGSPFFYDEGGNRVGEYSSNNNRWRIRSNLAARWEMGDWGATWNVRYYDDQDEDCQFIEDYGFPELCTDADRFTSMPQDNPVTPNGVWDGDGVNGDFLAHTPSATHHIGSTTYHDVSVYWNAPWNAKVTVGVNNVFDKNPPLAYNTFANTFDPQYEVPGRFMYMRYSQKF